MAHGDLERRVRADAEQAFDDVERMLQASEPPAPEAGVTKDRTPIAAPGPRGQSSDLGVLWLDD